MGGCFIFMVILAAIGVGVWAWMTNGLLAYTNAERVRAKRELADLRTDDERLLHALRYDTKRHVERAVLRHLPPPGVRER